MSTPVPYFSYETGNVDLLENDREVYPLDTSKQINDYNAKIISIMNTINAIPVPRLEDSDSEAYKEKAKTLILKLYGMYKRIEGVSDPNVGEENLRNKLFAFNSKYKANLENHFIWWENQFGPQTVQKPYGTYRRYGGKKRTHKRKTHVNKSRKNKKKRGNK